MADKKVFKIGNKVALYLEPPDLPRPDRGIGFSKTTIWVGGERRILRKRPGSGCPNA